MNGTEKFQKVIELCEKENVSAEKVSAWYDNEYFSDDMAGLFPDDDCDAKYGQEWKDTAPAEVIAINIIAAEDCLQAEIKENDMDGYIAGWKGCFAEKHPDLA